MDKQFFRDLLPLVNDTNQYSSLKDYAKARIGYYHSLLETIKDHQRVLEIQGAIAELKRIDTLRDEVTKGAE
jgi:hypothetical protein|tara:strand:+ start:1468 stop:1683 length:216 start_codon:yes stop_codon:yes gene_type:complete